jgi:hypothetical protein
VLGTGFRLEVTIGEVNNRQQDQKQDGSAEYETAERGAKVRGLFLMRHSI